MYDPRLAAPACLAAVLLLSACGTAASASDSDGPSSPAQDPAEEVSSASAPVPEGSGGDVRDDVNGDGYPDLLFLSSYSDSGDDSYDNARLAVVYGSQDGPDPATRTVFDADAVWSGADAGGGHPLRPGTADLDGDGFADIPVYAGSPWDGGRAGIVWGGPTGPDPDAEPTAVASADGGPAPVASASPVPGDFDGDGHADLALAADSASGEDTTDLTVLYGPFDRDGVPARGAVRAVDDWVGALVPAPVTAVGEGEPTPLLLRLGSDGEQPRNTLLVTDSGDPEDWAARTLVRGALAAFGDFDGDGGTDLAVGDDGTRNNEPGHGTEPPEVDQRLNVYHGPLSSGADPLSTSLTATDPSFSYHLRTLDSCDLDGDGTRTLAVGLAGHGVDTVRDTGTELVTGDAPPLVRTGPEDGPQGTDDPRARVAEVFACADYDADGSDELVVAYDPSVVRTSPVRWWVTDGAADESAFNSGNFGD